MATRYQYWTFWTKFMFYRPKVVNSMNLSKLYFCCVRVCMEVVWCSQRMSLKYSTDNWLIHFLDFIRDNNEKGLFTEMIMLDLQKAFGTVDHSILCGRLESIGVNPVNWLYSYISNRVWTVCQTKTWNFRTMYGNLWGTPGWGHFCFSFRACSSYECFVLRARRLYSKLLKQEYLLERLKSSFRKFYGRYGDLIQQYEVSLSRM